jgi:hypothetical protein
MTARFPEGVPMARRTWAIWLIGLTGCLGREVDHTSGLYHNQPVETPNVPAASVQAAARVDRVGRELLELNPFLGVEPSFQTYGRKEPEIFHPDPHGVFVTEGLVARCKTDAELAAVLATELGKMSAERRTADRMRVPDPLRTPGDSGGTMMAGGVSSDQNQLGMQALIDQKTRQNRGRPGADENPHALAEQILTSAGIDPKALTEVAPTLREAGRNHYMASHLGGRGDKPKWSN